MPSPIEPGAAGPGEAGDPRLVPVDPAQAEAFLALAQANRDRLRLAHPRWAALSGSGPSGARTFLEGLAAEVASQRALAFGLYAQGKLAGYLGLEAADWDDRRARLAFWLDAAYEGRGLMSRALARLRDQAFGGLFLHRLEIHCPAPDARAAALAARLGFRREGQLRQSLFRDGAFVDVILFAVLRTDSAG